MDLPSGPPIADLEALPTLDEYLSSVMADRPAKKAKFEVPAGATVVEIDSDDGDAPQQASHDVVDLRDSDDDDALPRREDHFESDAALARRLAGADYEADAALARRLAGEDDAARPAAPPPPTSGGVLVDGSRPPWSATADWFEHQHEPGQCGNFDLCSQGKSCFVCPANGDSTAHGLLPRPLPGQTIRVHYLPHARCAKPRRKGDGPAPRRDVDGTTATVTARSAAYERFSMPPFAGRVETVELGPRREAVYVLRNFDGARGATLAANLENCFGLDVLHPPSGAGTMAKCAAAQGNNCQDNYTKLYPLRMFADDQTFELLQPILDATMAAVNAAAAPGRPTLSLRRGERAGELITGEAQILRFRAGKTAAARGDKMHVHVDKPGTRWVALMSLGDSSSFVVDHAPDCKRCWTGGGNGTAGKKWKDWHSVPCPTCREIVLASGDCVLFFGDPAARVAHGNMGTRANTAPSGLPRWCYGGRVSCQYRLSAGFMDRTGTIY